MHMLESCPQFEAVISPGGAQPHADSIKSPGSSDIHAIPKVLNPMCAQIELN